MNKNSPKRRVAIALAALCLFAITFVIAARVAFVQESAPGVAQEPPAPANAPGGSVVRGRAVYEDTGRPIRRARVVLINEELQERSGLTDSDGQFTLRNVPAGRYLITAIAPGLMAPSTFNEEGYPRFDASSYDEMRKHFEQVEVDGKADKEVKVRASRGAAIAGKVSYADGDAAIGLTVVMMRKKDDRFGRITTSLNPISVSASTSDVRTDDRGEFRVAGLPPGEYVVAVSESVDHSGQNTSGGADYESHFAAYYSRHDSLLMTFHPSTYDVKAARVIKLEAGDERRGVDITVAERALRTISGFVTAARSHRPIVGARVQLSRRAASDENSQRDNSGYGQPAQASATTDEEGRWRLNEIPDGLYVIFVTPRDEYDSYTGTDVVGSSNMNASISGPPRVKKRYAPKRRELKVAGDIADLAIELSEGGRITGTLVSEDGKQVPNYGSIYAVNQSRGTENDVADGTAVGRVINGEFAIHGLQPGKFHLHTIAQTAEDEDKRYVKSIRLNGRDVTYQPIEVGEGASVEGVEIVFASDIGSAIVRVSTTDRKPARGFGVMLVPADLTRWSRFSRQIFCMTEKDGACTVNGAPGDYAVIVLRLQNNLSNNLEAEVMKRVAVAPRVTLQHGNNKTVEITVPGGN